MLTLLSPSKSVTEHPLPFKIDETSILFDEITEVLIKEIRSFTKKKLADELQISDSLADLNYRRYQEWDDTKTKPALWLYSGDVYNGLGAFTLNSDDAAFAQNKLLILSGLYGLVRPFDGIKPYRLEMKIKLKTKLGSDLYKTWSAKLVEHIISSGEKTILLCASSEYAKAISPELPSHVRVVTPRFMQETDDGLKEKGLFAKYARGSLARFVIDNRLDSINGLQNYAVDGFKYSKELSTDNELVYIVPKDFTLKGRFVKK